MKSKQLSKKFMEQLCGELREDDGVDPKKILKREQAIDYTKRDRQLCTQVRRAMNLALPEIMMKRFGILVQVSAVEPAPDIARLRVEFGIIGDSSGYREGALSEIKGQLRNAIAQEVNRKRTPEIILCRVPLEVNDED